jgi:hypothetical protein
MKAQIYISGAISGNYTLLSQLNNGNYKESMFNSKIVFFDSVTEAKKAIKNAYKNLCEDEPQIKSKMCKISKSKDNTSLYYDASKAILTKMY